LHDAPPKEGVFLWEITMAQAETFRFSGLRVLLGDGETVETFATPCGFTERSISFSKELGESNVPDCDNEDGASWIERDVVSKSATISGTGMLDAGALATWQDFWDTDASRNARVELWRNNVKTGHWAGAFHMEAFENTGTKGERVAIQVTMQSDGAVNWVAGA
jgi:predicted secreted protein